MLHELFITHCTNGTSIMNPFTYNKCVRSNLLLFLGGALKWITGTVSSKDVNSIKKRINQLIGTQSTQQEAIVHIVSILNVTRYAAQINRQHINIIMDKVDETVHECEQPLQLDYLSSYQSKLLPANTSHQICLGQPLGFPILHQNSFCAY